MSHFVVAVVAENETVVDARLAPYSEHLRVEPYVCWDREIAAREYEAELHEYRTIVEENDAEKYNIKYCTERLAEMEASNTEAYYTERLSYYEDEEVEDGKAYTRYNPRSKWDWWVIGGRWDGAWFKNNHGSVAQFILKLKASEWIPAFAFVSSDSTWYERGQMGWFAVVSDEKSEEAWKEEFLKLLGAESLAANVYIVDCHI